MGVPAAPAHVGAVAGIDLGGTQVRLAIEDGHGRPSTARTLISLLATPENLVRWVAEHISRWQGEPVRTIAVGAPGLVDPDCRRLIELPNLQGWRDVPLANMLEASLGSSCSVHLQNDANLAAVAELYRGAARGCRNLIYITWSTGIGGGLIVDGQLYTGHEGMAGEIGHMPIDADGPICACGQRGCLEALCGGASLLRQTGTSAEELFRRAAEGQQESRRVVDRACQAMGQALLILTNVLAPEVVVFGGGVATGSWELIEPRLSAVLAASPFISPERRPVLRPAELGTTAGEVGAVEWARRHVSRWG